jgi:hypothetical protein
VSFLFFLFCLAELNEDDNIGTMTNKDTELTCKNRNMAKDHTKGQNSTAGTKQTW